MEGSNPVRPSVLKPSGSYKSSPMSLAFRRLGSSRNLNREGENRGFNVQWITRNKILFWLLLISLWIYGGFYYVQSSWAHRDMDKDMSNLEHSAKESEIPMQNTTYGMLVGPFGTIQDRILEWSPDKQTGTCEKNSQFGKLVLSRKFVLVIHSLSMTGAQLAIMELATELLSCGAIVSVVALNKRGGLMQELVRRKIKVLDTTTSFKTAMKADLIIVGSVCSSWIEKYREHSVVGASEIAWWIMENRREHFDRAKLALSHVKKLIFISKLQSRSWLEWIKEENITIRSEPAVIPLSVNDELAFVAGISCSLNTPELTTEKMIEKRQLLRNSVRKETGLRDDDMLIVFISSLKPAKGQLLFLESVRMLIEHQSMTSRAHGMMFDQHQKKFRILIGSVGSMGNNVSYVKELLRYLSHDSNSNLSQIVIWTPLTTRVASLYTAADVYVMNSQGNGEPFGRVTIEAMAFGLPVLGTDAAGTKEILEDNLTGLMHPVGRRGAIALAKNLESLLANTSRREQMGLEGRKKVGEMYLKKHMYWKFGEVLYDLLVKK